MGTQNVRRVVCEDMEYIAYCGEGCEGAPINANDVEGFLFWRGRAVSALAGKEAAILGACDQRGEDPVPCRADGCE